MAICFAFLNANGVPDRRLKWPRAAAAKMQEQGVDCSAPAKLIFLTFSTCSSFSSPSSSFVMEKVDDDQKIKEQTVMPRQQDGSRERGGWEEDGEGGRLARGQGNYHYLTPSPAAAAAAWVVG
jgi:hypothetical protein